MPSVHSVLYQNPIASARSSKIAAATNHRQLPRLLVAPDNYPAPRIEDDSPDALQVVEQLGSGGPLLLLDHMPGVLDFGRGQADPAA